MPVPTQAAIYIRESPGRIDRYPPGLPGRLAKI